MTNKKVLLIEDNVDKQKMFIDVLIDKATIICVATETEAKKIFNQSKKITIIAVDACLKDNEPDTLELTAYIRSKYHGPIVAISSVEDYNKKLIKAGCSHQAMKDDAPSLIASLLDQNFQCQTIPYVPAKEASLEIVLNILHKALVPAGINESMVLIGKLIKSVKETMNEENRKTLIKVKKDLRKLKTLGNDPFSDPYVKQLSLIRDTLIPLFIT